MQGGQRKTNEPPAPSELSRRVREYYRQDLSREGWEEDFDRLVSAVWEDLLEAGRYGADAGFLLHVLVCTKFQRVTPNIERSPLREVPLRKRATLIGGLQIFRQLGWERFKEIFGPPGEKWAQEVYLGIEFIYQELTGGTARTPAFQIAGRARLTRRQLERPITACLVCMMEELKGRYPKPAAATAVLLQKFALLDRKRDGNAAIEFVKKRAQRAAPGVSDRLGAIWNPVWLLRGTYRDLKEVLMPPPVIPDRSPVWAEKGKAWRVEGPMFRGAFRRFCGFQGLRPTTQALAEFERSLQSAPAFGGSREFRKVFRSQTETDSQRRQRQKR